MHPLRDLVGRALFVMFVSGLGALGSLTSIAAASNVRPTPRLALTETVGSARGTSIGIISLQSSIINKS